MTGLLDIMRGEDPVSVDDAYSAFEVLTALLEVAPADPEAVELATSMVQRLAPDSLLAAVLDWWLVVMVGASPPLGLAYHLPESIPQPLRDAMQAVANLPRVAPEVPTGRWVLAARSLDRELHDLEPYLELDHYGKVPRASEWDVWAHLRSELDPVIERLRAGTPVDLFELSHRGYEKALRDSDTDENSRRWAELIKRAEECVSRVNEVVTLQAVVKPWLPTDLPPMVESVPPDLAAALGPLGHQLLIPVLDPTARRDSALPPREVAERLEKTAAEADETALDWLATVVDDWLGATGADVPTVAAALERRQILLGRLDRLRELGVDADDAELLLMDHQVSEAERVTERLEAGQRRERKSSALEKNLERLRGLGAQSWAPEDWGLRVEQAADLLTGGDVAAAEEALARLDREARGARRSEQLHLVESVLVELDRLDAPAALLADLGEQLEALHQSDRPVDQRVVDRANERLEALTRQRREEVEAGIATALELLEEEGAVRPSAELAALELRLSEVENELAVGEVMAAQQLITELLREIDSYRARRWTAADGEAALVDHLTDYCTQQLHFDPADIRRLYVAAKTKPFVILAGLTGSGKSTIARLFAAALGADSVNGRFRRVAVRPDWIDQSEVLGSVNPLSNRFEPGWLAEVARQCERNLDQLHVVLLDEMNLAPVEQYLAEYLSAIEEARSGSTVTTLPLYSSGADPQNASDWPPSLPFPTNLILIGTVNVDETTRVLSDRVLDRANVLQLSVAISDAHHRPTRRAVQPWHVAHPEWRAVCVDAPDDGHHDFLVDIGQILEGSGIGVGQRSHVELERFVANARGVLAPELALDLGVLQRFIPKIRGFKRDLVEGLGDLHEELTNVGCDRSAAVVGAWLDERVSDDEYLDGTAARIGLIR